MSELKIPNILRREEQRKLPPQERELYTREILRQTLDMNDHGATISELSKKLFFDPRTLEKHLSILTYTNEIYSVKIGPTNLYLSNSRAMHPVTEKSFTIRDRTYDLFELQNRLGHFILIQEKKIGNHRRDVEGGILIPFDIFPEFVDHLNNIKSNMEVRRD